MDTVVLSREDAVTLLAQQEGHFFDIKSKRIDPSKLSQAICALANADGGEICVGIEDHAASGVRWDGFTNEEAANDHINLLEELFPTSEAFNYRFLSSEKFSGLVLSCEVFKNQGVWKDSKDVVYLRKDAQNLKQNTPEKIERLRLNKGINSYEDQKVSLPIEDLLKSNTFSEFISGVVPKAEPSAWLRKQKLVRDEQSTVAAAVLYDDEPQTVLPKAAIKIARYKTSEEPSRATLDGNPLTIEGPVVTLIADSISKIVEVVEKIPVMKESGLKEIKYPRDAIHEIITNAVIHRDYSINDDVHVTIFDNRIEIFSPGPLPAHITVDNILDERFARNQKIVRLANKFPNPPNKDVGRV